MKIYLYGNCQTGALQQMILEDNPDWSVTGCDVSSMDAADPAVVRQHFEHARASEIVIAQPIGAYRGNASLSTDALRAELPAGHPVLTVVPIVFEGTQGAFTYLQNRLPGVSMPYNNSHSVDLFLKGYHWRDIRLLQASPDFYSPEFVFSGIDASVSQLRFRERLHETTVKVAETIEEYCRSIVLMNTINHPGRFLLARMLNAIYRHLSVPAVARETGVDYLDNPYVPPLPTVLHHLGLADERPQVEANGRVWTRDAYLAETLAYYARLLREDLLRALAGARGETFLSAFHKGRVSFPAGDEPSASGEPQSLNPHEIITAAYDAFLLRAPGPLELDAHAGAIRAGGLGRWLLTLANADELIARYHDAAAAD